MMRATISLEAGVPFWVSHNFKSGNFEALDTLISLLERDAGKDVAPRNDNAPLIHLTSPLPRRV